MWESYSVFHKGLPVAATTAGTAATVEANFLCVTVSPFPLLTQQALPYLISQWQCSSERRNSLPCQPRPLPESLPFFQGTSQNLWAICTSAIPAWSRCNSFTQSADPAPQYAFFWCLCFFFSCVPASACSENFDDTWCGGGMLCNLPTFWPQPSVLKSM